MKSSRRFDIENAKPESKLFGRYHDVVLLLLGFLLTSVIGGFLSFWYQARAWEREDSAKRHQEQLTRASAVYEEVSRLMDKRLFRLRTLEGALEQGATNEEIAAARQAYRSVVTEWNESLNRNLVLTEMYFGSDARREFEVNITGGFRSLQAQAIKTVADPTRDNIAALQSGANEINPHLYLFNQMLLVQLQRGEVGEFRPGQGGAFAGAPAAIPDPLPAINVRASDDMPGAVTAGTKGPSPQPIPKLAESKDFNRPQRPDESLTPMPPDGLGAPVLASGTQSAPAPNPILQTPGPYDRGGAPNKAGPFDIVHARAQSAPLNSVPTVGNLAPPPEPRGLFQSKPKPPGLCTMDGQARMCAPGPFDRAPSPSEELPKH